jgi:hypothetical protein
MTVIPFLSLIGIAAAALLMHGGSADDTEREELPPFVPVGAQFHFLCRRLRPLTSE